MTKSPKKKKGMASKLFTFFIVLVLCVISYTLSSAFVGLPEKMSQLEETVDSAKPAYLLYWSYTDENGKSHGEWMNLGITEEEFKESVMSDVMRKSTYFDPPGIHCVTPDNKYVQKIAERINEITEGYSDWNKARVALHFVQTAIDYKYDCDIYGWDEFTAYPIETLYLGVGDCEDTAILLLSIYLALGYDAVLLDFPEHVAVGVRWKGQDDYLFCETTCDLKSDFRTNLQDGGIDPHIYYYGSIPSVCHTLNNGMAAYRHWVERTLGF